MILQLRHNYQILYTVVKKYFESWPVLGHFAVYYNCGTVFEK